MAAGEGGVRIRALVAASILASAWILASCSREPSPSAPGEPAPEAAAPPADSQAAAPPPEPPPLHAGAFDGVSIHQGRTPSLAASPDGTLWAAFEHEEHVYVTRSIDRGATFGGTERVVPEPERIEAHGEGRPKIALGSEGTVYVSWTKKLAGRFTGDVRFSRSTDQGRSFAPVRTVNDDGLPIGHRFDALLVDARDHVYLVWIDKRDLEAARSRGEAYRAAGIYFAVSTDGGEIFSPNRRLAHHACECCRIAVAPASGGGAAVLWRHVFEPQIRDHAFAVLDDEGSEPAVQRASFEGWEIHGCPHHGPALEAGDGTGYHAAWFSAAGGDPAIYHGWIDGATGTTERTSRLAGQNAAHPDVLAQGATVRVVWKTLDEGRTAVVQRHSLDGGATWSEPSDVAETHGASDHPALLALAGEPFLAWHTATEGLRLIPLAG